jgi:hypothetical protein
MITFYIKNVLQSLLLQPYKSAKIDFNIYKYIFTLLNTIEIIIIYLDIPRFNQKWAWLNGSRHLIRNLTDFHLIKTFFYQKCPTF